MTGKIKFYNKMRGFGFITSGTTDVFLHVSQYRGHAETELWEGTPVEFTVEHTPKGIQALNVTRVADADADGNS